VVELLEGRRLLTTVPTGLVDEPFVTTSNLGSATSMAFAPDGRLFVTRQNGQLRVIKNGALLATPAVTLTVDSSGERGLLGIAFDPNFASNQYIYVYHTTPTTVSPRRNLVSRFTMSGDVVDAASQINILTLDALTSATNHNGGAMHFGSDGKLYIAVGDNATGSNSQSISNRHGKMLRINSDGTIPADNPTSVAGIAGTTSGVNRAIYSAGLRNPFTFAVQPGTGKTFVNDMGQNTWEEVNENGSGRNFGWPGTEGDFTQSSFPSFTRPVYAYSHGSGASQGFAITGGAFYNPQNAVLGVARVGDYFYGDYVNGWIRTLDAAANYAPASTAGFATGVSSLVDIDVGPDGFLYYLERGGPIGVSRIKPNTATFPSVTSGPGNQTVFATQSATFSVTASGQATLQYQWYRNNTMINGAISSSYTLTNAQLVDSGSTFFVRVTNGLGSVDSPVATLTVNANQLPVPVINTPAPGSNFIAGQTYNFAGTATDPEDGVLSPASTSWRVSYFTNVVERPFVPETVGNSGSFTIPSITPYTLPDVFYRIYFTATDSLGASVTVSRDMTPITPTITLNANLPGVTGTLDGQPYALPTTFVGVAGVDRPISVPATAIAGDGQLWEFVSWSNGGARDQVLSTPTTDSTFTAAYRDATAPGVAADVALNDDGAIVFTFVFTEAVAASLPGTGLRLRKAGTGEEFFPTIISSSYNATTYTAVYTIDTPGLPSGHLLADLPTFADGAGNLAGGPPAEFVLVGSAAGSQTTAIGTSGASLLFTEGSNTFTAPADLPLYIVPNGDDWLTMSQAALEIMPVEVAEIVIKVGSSLTAGSIIKAGRLVLGGELDLTRYAMILDYPSGAPSPIAAVIADYLDGRLTRDEQDANGLPLRLAIAEAGDLGDSTFGGVQIDFDTVLAKVSYVGDANLDGQVDALDYERVDLAIGDTGVLGTALGDLNYDTVVDALDYEQIDLNVGNGVGAPLGLLATSAPLPTGGLAGLFSKRRLDDSTELWA
jgi:glucose/arabinose dehydrogenase